MWLRSEEGEVFKKNTNRTIENAMSRIRKGLDGLVLCPHMPV